MHIYMRAIGFSNFTTRKDLKEVLKSIITNSDKKEIAMNKDDIIIAEFSKDFGESIGIAVCGEFDEDENFIYDYYFPYLRGTEITTKESITIERHSSKESYAGVCDELKVGVYIIFYLQNMMPYIKARKTGKIPIIGTSLTISALSINGTIMMSIQKDENEKIMHKKNMQHRRTLIEAARAGDETAIETLTLEDMDMHTTISRNILKNDIFTIVDTYFMPYGVECDQYSILGEIIEFKIVENQITNENIYILSIYCNEIEFSVAINSLDLYGEPKVGRRFKGVVWLQGFINYPEI